MRAQTLIAWVGVAVAGSAALALAAWRVDMPERGGMAPGDWEAASADDCELMARSMRALKMGTPDGPPLIAESRERAPCDWSLWNLRPGRLTHAEFAAATKGDKHNTGYIPHIRLSRPRYSLLRLRALVAVSHAYGWEGGSGHLCHLRRTLDGWRLDRCTPTWIA